MSGECARQISTFATSHNVTRMNRTDNRQTYFNIFIPAFLFSCREKQSIRTYGILITSSVIYYF